MLNRFFYHFAFLFPFCFCDQDGDYNKEIVAMYSYGQQSFGKEDLINNAGKFIL